MDLRVIKTKKNIREAFLELRKKYSVDEIKVNALCEKALVNKTTFYNHYQDVYALSEELEREVLEVFFDNFKDIDMMLMDAKRFMNGMHCALEADDGILRILFNDKLDELIERMEERIREYYEKEDQMLISFLMGGCVHLMMKSENNNEEVEKFLMDVITKLVEK